MSFDFKNYMVKYTNVTEKNVPFKTLVSYIKSYYNKNIDFFSSNGLTNCPTFGGEHRNRFMGIVSVDDTHYKQYIKESKNIDHTFEVSSNPVFVSLFFAASFDNKTAAAYLEFLAFVMYSSKFKKYFPYGAKQPVMDVLFNRELDNNTFIYKYKQVGRVLNITVETFMRHFGDKLYRATDDDVVKMLNSLSTRINELLKKISQKYYELEKHDNTAMFIEKTVMDEETMITVNTDHNKLQSLVALFRDEELKYGVKVKVYTLVDKQHNYFNAMQGVYKSNFKDILDLLKEMVNVFIRKRNQDMITFEKYFAHDVFKGTVKSFEITNLHITLAKSQNISTSKQGEFRQIVERYIALRVREIIKEVK